MVVCNPKSEEFGPRALLRVSPEQSHTAQGSEAVTQLLLYPVWREAALPPLCPEPPAWFAKGSLRSRTEPRYIYFALLILGRGEGGN